MGVINLSLNIKKRVKKILTEWNDYRDDDHKVTAAIWLEDCDRMGISRSVSYPLLKLYSEGKLTNAESIRRMRQKLQEHDPDLRGDKWAKKHKNQSNIKSQLRGHGRDIARGTSI